MKTVEDMQFDRGYLSPYFVTNSEKMEAELRPLHPHLRQENLHHERLAPKLGANCSVGRPLLILAEDIDGEALATLVVNKFAARSKLRLSRHLDSATARQCCRTSPS